VIEEGDQREPGEWNGDFPEDGFEGMTAAGG
jgi:hypothetical protein